MGTGLRLKTLPLLTDSSITQLKLFPGARRFDRGQTANLLTIGALEGALDILRKRGLKIFNNTTRPFQISF